MQHCAVPVLNSAIWSGFRKARPSRSSGTAIIPSCGAHLLTYAGKGLLYTRGSVPYYGTYPGLRVPRPLLLVPHEYSDSAIAKVAEEVLALTKVNWNSTQFDQKLPAPIKAAREVGRILSISSLGHRYRRTSADIPDA